MTAPQSKYTGWLIHLTAWAVIFGMPLFVTGPDRPLMSGGEYLRFLLVPLSFMVVFYTNYFGLIDRYLSTRRFGRFAGYNILLIGAVMVGVQLLFRYVLPDTGHHPPMERSWQDALRFFAGNAILYLLVVGAGVAIRMTGGWYRAEAARQELEHSRTEAELQNLKSPLNPHFLFNTLNNIYSLIQLDPDRAQQTVHDLSRLLRYVLYDSSRPTVPLKAEMDFLGNYIELMRIRLPRHVRLDVSLPENPSHTLVAPFVHRHRHPGRGRSTRLPDREQLLSQIGGRPQRLGHRACEPLPAARNDLSRALRNEIRTTRRHVRNPAPH